ncbi:MAG: hypothetical protein AABW45_02640 [Nanoarchaeota archaeon]
MKLRYLLPFLYFLNTQAQTKLESNLHSLNFKNEYVDIAAKDTFGLKDLVNIKGFLKLKYDNNSIYVARNGLLNHHYGLDLNFDYASFYFNNSNQNIKNESYSSQNSPIGKINTRTTILNKDKIRDFGLRFNYLDYFIGYEQANKENDIDGETFIEFESGQSDLIPYSFSFNSSSKTYTIGFDYGFLKFIENNQDDNKFNKSLIKASYNGLNLYHYEKDIASLFNFNFKGINLNLTLDKDLRFNLSTNNYSGLIKKDFERKLEDRLRLVPRIYDSNLETQRNYTQDMFFTEDFSFTLDKDNFEASINLDYLLAHYSKDSEKVGLKYKFAFLTYDTKRKEIAIGLYLN